MQHTDRYDDVSGTTNINMKGINTKEIEIEIKCNKVEINGQRDFLRAI